MASLLKKGPFQPKSWKNHFFGTCCSCPLLAEISIEDFLVNITFPGISFSKQNFQSSGRASLTTADLSFSPAWIDANVRPLIAQHLFQLPFEIVQFLARLGL